MTQVNTAQLNIQKSSSVQQAALGETYTYSVVIRNNGTVIATNVSFIDTVAPETTFVANSVTINGTSQPGFDPNVGFALPNIAAGTSLTVTVPSYSSCAVYTRSGIKHSSCYLGHFLIKSFTTTCNNDKF